MLIVKAENVGGTETSAEYDVEVYINDRMIWCGVVTGHNRVDGWDALLHRIADNAGIESAALRAEKETICRSKSSSGHCPLCYTKIRVVSRD